MSNEPQTRCGYAGIVGRANVGKSTLLNRILGQKLSITAPKPQTTRHRIVGVCTRGDTQILFVDTPGLHRTRGNALNRVLNRTALAVVGEVDCLLQLVAAPELTRQDQTLIMQLRDAGTPLLIVVNKIDQVTRKSALLPLLEDINNISERIDVVPVSALTGDNVDYLIELVAQRLPHRPFIYAEDQLSDRSEKFFVAELVREQLTRILQQELPYALTVEIERYLEHEHNVEIHALIWVARDSQRKIVIGHKGEVLKRVGVAARANIEELLGKPVRLNTWVKVKQGWADDERSLRSLGYGD